MKWLIVILLIPTIGWGQEKNDKTRFGFYIGNNMKTFSVDPIVAPGIETLTSSGVGLQLGSLYKLKTGTRNSIVASLGLNTNNALIRITQHYGAATSSIIVGATRRQFVTLTSQLSDQISILSKERVGIYIVGGFSANYLMENQEDKSVTTDIIKTWSAYVSAGLGLDIKSSHFTVSPELRYERSISDLNDAIAIPSLPSSRINSQTVFLTFLFS